MSRKWETWNIQQRDDELSIAAMWYKQKIDILLTLIILTTLQLY